MPTPNNLTLLGYLGLIALGLGVFLALAGFDIIKVEKVSVKTGRTTWVLGVFLIIIGCALVFGGGALPGRNEPPAQPAPSPTPDLSTPSPTLPAPEATATSSLPAATEPVSGDARQLLAEAQNWHKVMEDGFEGNANQWQIMNIDDEFRTENTQVSGGVLNWTLNLKDPNRFYAQIAPVAVPSNFYLSVRVRRSGETPAGQYSPMWGLFFRRHGWNGYAFRIDDSRQFTLQMLKENVWTTLIDATIANVNPGDFNTLAVIAQGAHMSFYINGEPVVEDIEDHTFLDGNVGFGVTVFYTGTPVGLEYDDFELRAAP
jgi:hypothetical protein